MDWTANVAVHESVSRERTRERIIDALKHRKIDPLLLYAGIRQTSRWIALHQSISPAQLDPDCVRIYHEAFSHLARQSESNVLHIVGLGCGDGTKDTNCLKLCRNQGKAVIYTPCDISLEMVLTASQESTRSLPGLQTTPLLCDLLHCSTLPGILKSFDPAGNQRVVLALGTIHNYAPGEMLKAILPAVRSRDYLVVSANLAACTNYEPHLERILGQYDNEPTRVWLWGALSELGITPGDGTLRIGLEPVEGMTEAKQIVAEFQSAKPIQARMLEEVIRFQAGEKLKVFTSSRFTSAQIRVLLEQSGLRAESEWITRSEEEGVWIARRA